MNTVIKVDNLSKKYIIGHQVKEPYQTLRDTVARKSREIGKRLLHPFLSSLSQSSSGTEEFWALKDVSFEVQQGDRLGIIGRNGAGKSTLLKVLSRITEPTKGRIHLKGRVASLLEVGTGFHPELTGRENIFLNGAILGMGKTEIKKKFDEIVAFAEVEKFLDTPVKHYSSGMYVRLAFAVAAHLEPEILIVDEVLAVGDAQFQNKCLGRMQEVGEEGRTVIFVSHNMAAVSALCTNGIILEKGKLKFSGTVANAINNYVYDISENDKGKSFQAIKRSGSNLVEICDLKVYSESLAQSVICGKRMKIEIEYKTQKDGLPIQFLVGVYDLFNTRVLFLDTSIIEGLPQHFPSKGKLIGEFSDEFSLFPGRSSINIAARVNGKRVDYIQDALTLNVEQGDFFGTGKFPSGKPLFLVKQKWHIENSD
jgi:lipopolysaccharide transport system ATP-binding protein